MTSFKKYQVDDLTRTGDDESDGKSTLTIQEDGTVSEVELFLANENLTADQVKLLNEISEQFSTEDNAADLSILYEVTGFMAESDNF